LAGAAKPKDDGASSSVEEGKPVCGLIMPISAMPPVYEAQHWADVRAVFEEAIVAAEMQPQMVSDSFESDVIQQRIISNIFNNPVVVCDVSGLNANVMFELGMRLASKKATIIVTDSYEKLPFDTRIIDHLLYPRNLRIKETREFMELLADRVKRAHDQVTSVNFRPFLDNFAGASSVEPALPPVSDAQYIKEQLASLQRQISTLGRSASPRTQKTYWSDDNLVGSEVRHRARYTVRNSQDEARSLSDQIMKRPGVLNVEVEPISSSLAQLTVTFNPTVLGSLDKIDSLVATFG
jgi:hypothetical protein